MKDVARPSILIGVCTYQRPRMLARCLASLSTQSMPDWIKCEIVVVDNEAHEPRREFVENFASVSPILVHYRCQSRRGISAARNAVLDAALEMDVDYIAFIDDDEEAAPDWVACLMAPEYLAVPVLAGHHLFTCDPSPFSGYVPQPRRTGREGKLLKTACTNNVRFSIDLVRYGLRFDEALGFMGGEDQLFFTAARNAGFEIRRTERAITYETIHPERATFWGQVHRAYWCAASDVQRLALQKGWQNAFTRKSHTIPTNILFGITELMLSPAFALGGRTAFQRRAASGGKKIAKAAGRVAALAGHLPQPYRTTVGN